MGLKFAANIGTMFPRGTPLIDRLRCASRLGFTAIEVAFPYLWPLKEWKTGLEQYKLKVVLINTPLGTSKEPGLAGIIGRVVGFREGMEEAIQYCKALGCNDLHVMSGQCMYGMEELQEETYITNIKWAGKRLFQENIRCHIETISEGTIEYYYLSNLNTTLELMKKIDSDNVYFQCDFFHLGMLEEDGCAVYKANKARIRHIQVAQTTEREEISESGGVDYEEVFKLLRGEDYQGYIGLEFMPRKEGGGSLAQFYQALDMKGPVEKFDGSLFEYIAVLMKDKPKVL